MSRVVTRDWEEYNNDNGIPNTRPKYARHQLITAITILAFIVMEFSQQLQLLAGIMVLLIKQIYTPYQ